MTTIALLDVLKDCPAKAAELAEALIDAMRLEAAALKRLDSLRYPEDPDDAARRRSRRVFAAWHHWLAEAEVLLDQLVELKPTGALLTKAREFEIEIGDASLRAKITLESVERGRGQVLRGEVVSSEEVRRELRVRLDKRRSA